MNLIPFFECFFTFAMNDFLDGLYVAWVGFAAIGATFALFRKKRYIHV